MYIHVNGLFCIEIMFLFVDLINPYQYLYARGLGI